MIEKNHCKRFYEHIDRDKVYTIESDPEKHPFYGILAKFIEKWQLEDKKCLEIGSSKGLFQDIVKDYTGIDIAEHLSKYYHKQYYTIYGAELPFSDESFDAIFTYATHEHIPELEKALNEILRALKPGGVCLLAPAWHTRPWFSKGLQIRPYSDLTLNEKVTKFTIPIRDFVLVRWPLILLRRLWRLLLYCLSKGEPKPLRYKKLDANYDVYWQSDSDACNSIDPFDVILWFKSRDFICHGYDKLYKALFIKTYALELQKR